MTAPAASQLEPAVSREVDDLLLAVADLSKNDLPLYAEMVRASMHSVEPVFLRSGYSEFFWHCAGTVPGWLAEVVIANAGAEAQGSEKLWKLWRSVEGNEAIEKHLLRHAYDESRHSRLFVRLATQVFPSALSPSQRTGLETALPDVRSRPAAKAQHPIDEMTLIDHLLQMNMGEIRTRIHMKLLGPALYAFAPQRHKDRVEATVYGLLRDEVRHIGYTAQLLEEWAREGAAASMRSLFTVRLREFSQITLEQTESSVRMYGQGQFPNLLAI